MQIWNYEPETGILVGPGTADPCPIEEGNFLIPANATAIEPPSFDSEAETCAFRDGRWLVSARPQAVAEPKPDLSATASEAFRVCVSVCEHILSQIYPDPIRKASLQTAATILSGNGGEAPTTGPYAEEFSALAALYIKGDDAASAFAATIGAIQSGTIKLNIALTTLQASCAAVTKASQLKAAIETFQASVTSILDDLNATRLPSPVLDFWPVEIPGINA